MSGHSKWATTKHKKAIVDAKRGKMFAKMVKNIEVAARIGGPDPDGNPTLYDAIQKARKSSVPKDHIDRAVKRGGGVGEDAVDYITIMYEGYAPGGVALLVECLTDNKNRTATAVRVLFRKGQLGSPGSVSWDFTHVGLVDATPPEGADVDETAIEAGAQDFEPDGEGGIRFYTEPTDLDAVSKAISARGWEVATMRLGWRPKNPVKVEDAAARTEVESFLADMDEDDDVQHIYVGYA